MKGMEADSEKVESSWHVT